MMHYWKVRLTTYSPTFVGSGETYQKDSYIYDRKNKTVRFLKEEKWISFLDKHHIMDDFAEELFTKRDKFNLFNYLSEQSCLKCMYGSVWNVIHAMEKAGVIDRKVNYYSLKSEEPGDIKGHIRDVEGNLYIPGSSLKGAFRTAILSHEIKKNSAHYRSEWINLQRADGNEERMRRVAEQLERKIGIPDGKDMGESYFRGLMVSDAVWVKGDTCVTAKVDLTIGDDSSHQAKLHQVKLYRECLDIDSVLEFTIGIDDSENGMGHYGIRSFSDLQKVLQKFVDFQYEILQRPFHRDGEVELKDIKDHQYADLLLGGGTGFLSKTLLYSLAPDRKSAIEVTRRLLAKKSRAGKHDKPRAHVLSPHTLKLTSRNGYTYLMGLCRLEEEKKLC